MATTITATPTTAHLDIVWSEDATVLADLLRAVEGREVTLVRIGSTPVMRTDEDGARWDTRLITDRGRVTGVRLSPSGTSVSFYVGGVPTSLVGAHPVADATRFTITTH